MARQDFGKTLWAWVRSFLAHYGTVLALIPLGLYYSWATWTQQHEQGAASARSMAREMIGSHQPGDAVLILASRGAAAEEFARLLEERLEEAGLVVAERLNGAPSDVRRALESAAAGPVPVRAIAGDRTTLGYPFLRDLGERFPPLGGAEIHRPRAYHWPAFLTATNLINVAGQISVIAILAIGMTMVIITAGIDLSVGSLIALSSVICAWIIQQAGGAAGAGVLEMAGASAAAILACAMVGAFTGAMVAQFAIPAFVVTLAMMMACRGLAFIISGGESINDIPDGFTWMALGKDLMGIPNGVILMVALFVLAHLIMSLTRFGRYIYAIGGNLQAARLSGIPVKRVILSVYVACGAMAGLGGVLMTSQLQSGSPKNGAAYELQVIAAVVIGGTSLFGGEGRVFGTLIGALIMAVISNGMNLTGVDSYTQDVVFGLAVLGAVLLDRIKKMA